MSVTPKTLAQKRLALRRRQTGEPAARLVPPGPAVEHLQRLRDWGMSADSIAIVSGVTRAVIANLLAGNSRGCQHILSTTEAKILTVELSTNGLPDRAWVNSIGTARRIQGLCANGWSMAEIGRRLGMAACLVQELGNWKSPNVTAGTHRKIQALSDSLEGVEGSSVRARRYAQSRGWVATAAWDDEAIDDPSAEPQHDARLTREQIRNEAVRLVGAGENYADVAEALGCSVRTVERAVARAEREVA